MINSDSSKRLNAKKCHSFIKLLELPSFKLEKLIYSNDFEHRFITTDSASKEKYFY